MITLLAFLFVIGVLIFVHELGHFIMARLNGVRVVTFSLGFGPKLLKYRRGDTEYRISAVPLGGYVKLAGESAEEERTGAPDEFLSKSKWQRFLVYIMGPVMNILLAVALLTAVLYRGADVPIYHEAPAVLGSVERGSVAEKAGLRPGDRITRVGDEAVPTWDAFQMAVAMGANRQVVLAYVRDGRAETATVTPAAVGKYDIGELGVAPVLRPEIVTVVPGQAAEKAGFVRGDVILAVNGDRGLDHDAVLKRIQGSPSRPLVFTVERDGQPRDVTVTPSASGLIGAGITGTEVKRIDPTFFQAIGLSVQKNIESAAAIVHTLAGLFTARTPMRTLIGPIGIAQLSGGAAQLGWIQLFDFMAMISLNLGLLNLMPIPVLDGGHIAILGLEGLVRRDFSVKLKERILFVGFGLILALMATAIFNDVVRLFR